MIVHQARQRKGNLRWDYTCTNSTGAWALGYCATRPEGHPDGHDTAAEAEACYRRYEVREASVFGDHPDEQHKCRVCGTWTQRGGVVGREFTVRYPLCAEHATVDHLEALHVEGRTR